MNVSWVARGQSFGYGKNIFVTALRSCLITLETCLVFGQFQRGSYLLFVEVLRHQQTEKRYSTNFNRF